MACLVRICGRLRMASAQPSQTISPALTRRSGRSDRCADTGRSRTSSRTSRRRRAWVRCAGLPVSWARASTSTCITTGGWPSIATRLRPRPSSGIGGSSPAPCRRSVPPQHGLVRWSCMPKTFGIPLRSRTRPRLRSVGAVGRFYAGRNFTGFGRSTVEGLRLEATDGPFSMRRRPASQRDDAGTDYGDGRPRRLLRRPRRPGRGDAARPLQTCVTIGRAPV